MRMGLLLAPLLVAAMAPPPTAARTVVLVSPGPQAYLEAAEGAREARGEDPSGGVDTVVLDQKDDGPVSRSLRDADVVIAIGSRAARMAREAAPEKPLVYAMVLDPASVGLAAPGEVPREGNTGVTMDVSTESQFALLRQIAPDVRRVGVLFDPAVSGPLVRAAMPVARAHGMELVAQAVRDDGAVVGAANLLLGSVDALWVVADPTILTQANARALILIALRTRKPLIALSEGFVRTGALAALAADPREVGRRAGSMARRIADGTPVREVTPEAPPRLDLYINRATAEHIGVLVPADLIERARTVFPKP